MSTPREIVIDGVVYKPEVQVKSKHDLPFVIIRTRDAGVHAGYLESSTPGGNIVLRASRRLWKWTGAGSLSEIAVYGCNPAKDEGCRFGAEIDLLKLRYDDACEEIHCQPAGQKMIQEREEWRA